VHIRLHVTYLLFLSDFNGNGICLTDFRKLNTKFHENSSSGSRIVPRRQTRQS